MVCNIYFYLHYDQSENMTNKWHVYMTKDGRISLAGLSLAKCEYLADAIIDSYHNVNWYKLQEADPYKFLENRLPFKAGISVWF